MTALSVTATWLLRYEKDNPLAAGQELLRQLDAAGYVVTRKEAGESGAARTATDKGTQP